MVAMRLTYTFPNVPRLKGLSVEVENRGDRLRSRVSGPGSLTYGLLLKLYFAYWRGRQAGPIVVREEGNVYSLYIPPIPSPGNNRNLETMLRSWLCREPRPLAVTIGVTTRCQLGCLHCSAAGVDPAKPVLTREEMRRVVDESLDLGVVNITFTGGEPLLRDDLEELVAMVPRDKAVALVFTNAVDLDAARARRLKEAGTWALHVSLDSPDPDEHDAMRRRAGTFKAVRDGVRAALEAGLMVCLSTYATNESVRRSSLTRLAALGAEWGVQEITVFDCIPTGRLLRREEMMLTPASRRLLLREARGINRRLAGRPRVVTQSWTNTRSGLALLMGCLAGHMQFHLTADGEFTPCDFTPLSFGNVREASVGELWRRNVSHPAYRRHQYRCRMQDPAFRERYVNAIPEGACMPYPIDKLGTGPGQAG